MDKIEILQGNPLYNSVPENLQREMREYAIGANLPAGSFFVHEGDHFAHLAMVGAGRLRVYKAGETGREITLYHVGPGECCLLNMISLVSDAPSPASAVVMQSLEAALLPADRFRAWMSTQAAVQNFVFTKLSSQVVEMMSLVEEVTFDSMDRRLAGFLVGVASSTGGGEPQVEMTHDQIACELGTAREVVSRLLKNLERRGLVELNRGCVRIVDQRSLAAKA